MKIQKFPSEVVNNLKWYVYRLIDPRDGCTFYVGKGCGNRIFSHVCEKISVSDNDSILLSNKLKQIRSIRLAGLEVIHVIHRHGMDENTAYEVEAALIDAYPGLSNSINGVGSNEFGVAHVKEIIELYQPEQIEFKHKCLIISVNRSAKDSELYDAVRFSWRVNIERAKKATVILATIRGIVRGVFIADQWLKSTRDNFSELALWDEEFEATQNSRYGFVGREAEPDIVSIYLGKRIPDDLRKKGAMSPIRYSPGFD